MNQRKIPYNKSQYELLQSFKGKNEDSVPSLDQALRRAARFGAVDDLDQLLSLGANINAQDDKQQLTALHIAVMFNKNDNAKFLLSRFAKDKIKDANDKTPYDYSVAQGNEELQALLKEDAHSVLRNADTLSLIIEFLPFDELHELRRVSKVWKRSIDNVIDEQLLSAGFTAAQTKIIKQLDSTLRHIVYRNILVKKNRESGIKLISILEKNSADRANELRASFAALNANNVTHFISDAALVGLYFNLLKIEVNVDRNVFLYSNKYLILALEYELINYTQISKFKHSGSSTGSHDNLSDLLTKYGVLALKQGLLSADDAPFIYNLRTLLTVNGLSALREKLITIPQVRGLYHSGSTSGPFDTLKFILTNNGLIALRKGYITATQIAYISYLGKEFFTDNHLALLDEGIISYRDFPDDQIKSAQSITTNITSLTSESGMIILKGKVFTQEQLCKLDAAKITAAMTADCLQAINDGVLTASDVSQINDLRTFCSPQGRAALKEGVLTLQQAKSLKKLRFVNIPGAITALKEGLVTCEDFDKFRNYGETFEPRSVSVLFSGSGLDALRERLITVDQARTFYHSGSIHGESDCLDDFLNPLGLVALREKLVDISKASRLRVGSLFKINDPVVVIALRNKLISLDEYRYGGKCDIHPANMQREVARIKVLVENFLMCDNPEIRKASLTIQSHFRAHLQKQKSTLYNKLQICMKTASIHNLELLLQARMLIEKNKLKDAEIILEKLAVQVVDSKCSPN